MFINNVHLVIEVAAREYGDYHDELVNEVKNGKIYEWLPANEVEKNQQKYLNSKIVEEFEMELDTNLRRGISTPWLLEYKILCTQRLRHMWRDKVR